MVDEDSPESGATQEPSEEKAIDYKAFYEKVNSSFKANNKLVELRSPEEAIQLMQMGANYTKKMQEMAAYRKQVTMLQKNDLLDEQKLSYLIDLSKGEPEALKKLMEEHSLDPLDVDMSVPNAYVGGNHTISDNEIRFKDTLDTLTSTPEGQQAVSLINTEWDQASKDALWKDPGIMSVMADHVKSGMYQVISQEIERQRTLGNVPDDVSFLKAYQAVGEHMGKAGLLKSYYQQAPIAKAKGIATGKSSNAANVSAAAPTRAVKKTTAAVDLSNLDDAQFMEAMKGRL